MSRSVSLKCKFHRPIVFQLSLGVMPRELEVLKEKLSAASVKNLP